MTLLPLPLRATGDYWTAPSYLDGSGKVLKSAPEFFWHDEIQRLAEKYREPESAGMKVKGAPAPNGFVTHHIYVEDQTAHAGEERSATVADLADFEDALKTGKLKPADPAAAKAAHVKAREAIEAGQPLPAGEADSEFADYHAGAAAKGKPEAAAAWQKLLARPKEQRHYRSTWAAFMLGKHALATQQWNDAVKYFQQCRALAKEGFADSLALAADSFGWEGRAALMREDYPGAARLYLTQLALGDPSAAVSLKRCIPGWTSPMSGGLPGEAVEEVDPDKPAPEPAPAPEPTAEETAASQAKLAARWTQAAKDPALQELITAHILATDTAEWNSDYTRSTQWLEVITKAGVEKVEDAARLAWLSYNAGDYKGARAWLTKADAAAPLAQWLEAKFALRDGKLDAAGKIMPKVAGDIPKGAPFEYIVTPHDRARGELGALLYSRGQFTEAFAEFLKGNCDEDMKFMIESVLTVDELLAIAEKVPAPKLPERKDGEEVDFYSGPDGAANARVISIRSQIGRRLVREGKVKQGRPFLTAEESKAMDDYIALVLKGEDKQFPAAERAQALWEAGVMMLARGHEFRGTEDDFHKPSEDGYEYTVRGQRLTGKFQPQDYSEETTPRGKRPVFLVPSGAEKKRLADTAKQHAKPARTRMVAISHVLAAAALLPEKSELKARALNTAGFWLQTIDNPAADKIYLRFPKEFAATKTGAAVLKRKWFTGTTNPWKEDEAPEEEAPPEAPAPESPAPETPPDAPQ